MDERTSDDAARQSRDRDRRHVWHTWSPLSVDRSRMMFSSGQGATIRDVDGREYLDASSLNSTCGYAHPDVVGAIERQARRLHGVDISVASHELAGSLAARLSSYLPAALTKTVLVNSGSEGIEASMVVAADYWSNIGEPRQRVVAFERGYHGSTLIARSLSGLPRVGHAFQPPFPVTRVELPAPPRLIRKETSLGALLDAFERAIGDDPDDRPMAVVVEPFINVGGGIALPPGFLRGLRARCDATGTLLVLDEVFTGYARTGKMFAFQHDDIEPDILVSSKGLAGGYVPVAAVTVRESVHDSFHAEPFIGGLRYGHTTSGHAIACAAALATLDVIEKENLAERAQQLGRRLLDRMEPLAGVGEVVDVRGLGLILAVELSSCEAASTAVARAEEAGLLLRQAGEVVMAVPPLLIDEAVADAIADGLAHALSGAVR